MFPHKDEHLVQAVAEASEPQDEATEPTSREAQSDTRNEIEV
jgi:hypothetical protein